MLGQQSDPIQNKRNPGLISAQSNFFLIFAIKMVCCEREDTGLTGGREITNLERCFSILTPYETEYKLISTYVSHNVCLLIDFFTSQEINFD